MSREIVGWGAVICLDSMTRDLQPEVQLCVIKWRTDIGLCTRTALVRLVHRVRVVHVAYHESKRLSVAMIYFYVKVSVLQIKSNIPIQKG